MTKSVELVRPGDVYLTDGGGWPVVGVDVMDQHRLGREPVRRVRVLFKGGSVLIYRAGETVDVDGPD